jgi:hypothetical protein
MIRTNPTISNQQFLNAMFQDIPKDAAAITCRFEGDPNDDEGDRKYKWVGRAWRPGKGTFHLRGGTNNYLVISSFLPDPESGKFRRRKAQFAQMHGLMVDDIGTKVKKSRLRLPLSAIVETSPGNFQGWYFLSKSAGSCNFATADATLAAMVANGLTADGSDPGMKGVTRYGRLPVGINAKAKYVKQLGQPFACRVTAWNPERRYSIEEIAKAYHLDITAATRSGTYMRTAPMKLPRGEALRRANDFEALLKTLSDAGLYVSSRGPWHEIICPWLDEHTDQKANGTALYVPATGNAWLGGFKCHHGHCERRTVGDVYKFIHVLIRGAA